MAHPSTSPGKWFNVVSYKVREDNHQIDYDAVAAQALETKPKLIIAGGSAYPRTLDFKRFREIADSVGAYLMVDMAHFAGLVAGGAHANPVEQAHVVTTTTHKTLRGPRGGLILTNDEALAKKFNSAIFPGIIGGPLEHVIAAKAVAFGEALKPAFKKYAGQVVKNAKVLAETMMEGGCDVTSGGTDTHLMLVDLRKKNVTGKAAEQALGRAFITCNKNSIPFDPAPFTITSGIRLGSPAGTTRGFAEAEFREAGHLHHRSARWSCPQWRRWQRQGRSRRQAQGSGPHRKISDLRITPGNALSVLRQCRYAGQRQPRVRGFNRHPAPQGLSRLRRQVHHL